MFYNLPETTLGAIVVHAVGKLIDFTALRHMWGVRQLDFWAGFAAFLGVLLFGILKGVILGELLSLLILIYRASLSTATKIAEGGV